MLYCVGKNNNLSRISPRSKIHISHRDTRSVNEEDLKSEKKQSCRNHIIELPGLIHKRENKINPRLACLMYQNTCLMYFNINNKEARNSVVLLKSMSNSIQSKKEIYKVEDSWGKDENNQTLKQMINIPYELIKIQPIATQVWNLYEIGFDTNGNCHKVICT